MRTPSSSPLLLGLLLLSLAACDGPAAAIDAAAMEDAGPVTPDTGPPPALPDTIGPSERPAQLVVPGAHDGVSALPAIVLLHGYGAGGTAQATYFGIESVARREGFYLVLPDGTVDASGRRFWNATPACCDFGATQVDDVAYITSLIDELESLAPVERVFLLGHSNGGFMSYRMACERSERIAGIASLAGSDYPNDDDCVATAPVPVLQIHGDLDTTIEYAGAMGAYPSAADVVARWATRAGCDGTTEMGEPLDLDGSVAGAETEVLRYTAGCAAGAELWTLRGGGHIPPVTRDFTPRVLAWMRAQ